MILQQYCSISASMRFIILLLISCFVTDAYNKGGYSGVGPIAGATPCCMDRLTTIVCQRIKEKSSSAFLHSCLSNPDFAFVQCCRTCFSIEPNDPYRLDYQKIVQNLLMSPQSEHTCYNRRSNEWCNEFVMRALGTNQRSNSEPKKQPFSRSLWSEPEYKRFNCANVPIAFRECRHACGYCRLSEDEKEVANYDYRLATDPISCHNPSYGLAFHTVEFKKVFQKFETRFARYLRMRKMRQTAMVTS